MMLLGGTVVRQPGGFTIMNGRANVDLAFMADIDAVVSARDAGPGVVDISCQIRLTANTVFWLCLFLGLCTVVAWVVPVLFFVCDPRRAYDQIIVSALPGAVATPLPGFGP